MVFTFFAAMRKRHFRVPPFFRKQIVGTTIRVLKLGILVSMLHPLLCAGCVCGGFVGLTRAACGTQRLRPQLTRARPTPFHPMPPPSPSSSLFHTVPCVSEQSVTLAHWSSRHERTALAYDGSECTDTLTSSAEPQIVICLHPPSI